MNLVPAVVSPLTGLKCLSQISLVGSPHKLSGRASRVRHCISMFKTAVGQLAVILSRSRVRLAKCTLR